MNLVCDAWLPVIWASGKKDKIAPWQIAETTDPVMDLDAPRPDFQGALYQFLIGLLQTCFAPADHEEWLEYWKILPDSQTLRNRFLDFAPAFELSSPSGSPAFMQDLNLSQGKMRNVAAFLMDFPGDKTIVENLDHFIKRDSVTKMCPACVAMALFTLQLNAPTGGNGHRVGLRGGGPLTTLVRPTGVTDLWSKIWLNVLAAEDFDTSIDKPVADVFPWMGSTRVSTQKVEKKIKSYIGNGVPTTPADTHILQCYWGMPRRIRILWQAEAVGRCDLCDNETSTLARKYMTDTWGVDYVGGWVHPLTPYRFDPQKEKPPLSIKGQKGGLGYRHWVALTLAHSREGEHAAKIVRAYIEQRSRDIRAQRTVGLWCFGYDMVDMKARCWYDHTLPLFRLDQTQQENVLSWASELINAAEDVVESLQKQIKAAWFRRPGDVKGDMSGVVQEFWQQSEPHFYELLEHLVNLPGSQRLAPPEIYDSWAKRLQGLAYKLFDEKALEGPAEDLDMKRIIIARQELTKKLKTNKSMKDLIAKIGKKRG